jgi:hypothetical protein
VSVRGGVIAAPNFLREYLSSDTHFYLYELDDTTLDFILALSVKELDEYVYALICRFYPNVAKNDEKYKQLKNAYKSSFAVEKIYRVNSLISNNYTAIYTKTGLIRELVIDLYNIGMEKVVIN